MERLELLDVAKKHCGSSTESTHTSNLLVEFFERPLLSPWLALLQLDPFVVVLGSSDMEAAGPAQ